jgi:hypothetical protein
VTGLIILVGVISAVVVILGFIGYGLIRRKVSRALGRATGDLVGDSEDPTLL